jgi:hypothetical protein
MSYDLNEKLHVINQRFDKSAKVKKDWMRNENKIAILRGGKRTLESDQINLGILGVRAKEGKRKVMFKIENEEEEKKQDD